MNRVRRVEEGGTAEPGPGEGEDEAPVKEEREVSGEGREIGEEDRDGSSGVRRSASSMSSGAGMGNCGEWEMGAHKGAEAESCTPRSTRGSPKPDIPKEVPTGLPVAVQSFIDCAL